MSLPRYLRGYCGRIAAAAERLAMVSLECRPALEVIDYGRHRDVLLYVDPPYLAGTRTSVNYRHEMAAEADHRELAAALHAARPSVTNSVATAHISRAASKWTRRPLCPEASSAPCGPALFACLTCADRVPACTGVPRRSWRLSLSLSLSPAA
jgi:D12 class N6 adenine-specific DNA methyltransferase